MRHLAKVDAMDLRRPLLGSIGLHLAVLIGLVVLPVVLWWDREIKTPPTISMEWTGSNLELEAHPLPTMAEVEVLPPLEAEAQLVEAELVEENWQLDPNPVRSPLESWPSPRELSDPQSYRLPVKKKAQIWVELSPLPEVAQPGQPDQPDPGTESVAATPSEPGVNAATKDPEPDAQSSPAPAYPLAALRRHLTGVVQVLAEVDAQGKVASVRIAQTSGHGVLDRAALDAVSKWKFHPATRDGHPVPGAALVPVRFRFRQL
jgi:periplasmic protein TonB